MRIILNKRKNRKSRKNQKTRKLRKSKSVSKNRLRNPKRKTNRKTNRKSKSIKPRLNKISKKSYVKKKSGGTPSIIRDGKHIIRGINNHGNSCYANGAIQLFLSSDFLSWVIKNKKDALKNMKNHKDGDNKNTYNTKSEFNNKWNKFFENYFDSTNNIIAPEKNIIIYRDNQTYEYNSRQQDSHEFSLNTLMKIPYINLIFNSSPTSINYTNSGYIWDIKINTTNNIGNSAYWDKPNAKYCNQRCNDLSNLDNIKLDNIPSNLKYYLDKQSGISTYYKLDNKQKTSITENKDIKNFIKYNYFPHIFQPYYTNTCRGQKTLSEKLFFSKNYKKPMDLEDTDQLKTFCYHTGIPLADYENYKFFNDIEFIEAPPIIILNFIRFDNMQQKISDGIKIYENIQLRIKNENKKYILKGILNHLSGNTISSGHYTTHVYKNNKWYYANDNLINNENPELNNNNNCYIILYEREDLVNQSTNTNYNNEFTKIKTNLNQ